MTFTRLENNHPHAGTVTPIPGQPRNFTVTYAGKSHTVHAPTLFGILGNQSCPTTPTATDLVRTLTHTRTKIHLSKLLQACLPR